MREIVAVLITLIFIMSCAGLEEVKTGPNYSGRWIGKSFIGGQGITDNLDLTLVH